MAGYDLPMKAIRQQVASALDLIVHLERLNDGSRKVVAITEVQGMESDVITLQDLFSFHIDEVTSKKGVVGALRPTGLRPTFVSQFEKNGVTLPPELFAVPTVGGAPLDENRARALEGMRSR
jgi:pilus assembly protein CpaF